MRDYFPEPKSLGERERERVKVELDLSNFTAKSELKNTAGVDTSKISKEIDSADLKSNFGKLDIDKLKMFQQI